MAYHVAEDDSILELQVSATESAVALKSWKVRQKGNDLFISARKVLVSKDLTEAMIWNCR